MIQLGPAATLVYALVATVGAVGTAARVRREPPAIVPIYAGEFAMGATPDDLHRAVQLCQRDPLWQDPEVVHACLGVPREYARNVCQPGLFTDEVGAHRVWLRAFGIDRTEVTVGAYARCVAAGACGVGIVALGTPLYGGATQPIVGVTWDDAVAYCGWVGGRLPTEAEWERAARGRTPRPFPWGRQFDPRRANHGALVPGCRSQRDGYLATAPVGSYPDGASPDGVEDMAGNVAEWVADYWDDAASRYPADPTARRVDPRGPTHGALRVVRGGAYDHPAFGVRTTHRSAAGSGARSLSTGFRCAYDVAP